MKVSVKINSRAVISQILILHLPHTRYCVPPNTETIKLPFDIRTKSGYESLFREHYQGLCTYVHFYLKDFAAAEEVVQELFYNLWKKRDELDINTSIKSYLYKAARNQSLNVIKHIEVRENYKKINEEQRQGSEMHIGDEVETIELQDRIQAAINLLPPERKKIFLMSRYEDLKYREIAEKLNISVKTVEAQMGKALRFLKQQLNEYLPLWLIILLLFF